MKINCFQHLLGATLPALLLFSLAPAGPAQTNENATDFPASVKFELGEAEFFPSDSITVESVRGTSSTIRTGETYCVEGTYTLASREAATLALFATTVKAVSVPTDPSQTMRIKKGTGRFRLVKVMREEGYLHVSFYPVPSGSAFGGVYFGQGKWVLHHKGWSYLDQHSRSPDYIGTSGVGAEGISLAPQNRVLLRYLGEPVEPPADMDEAYTKEGLIKAIHTAAENAGVKVERVEVEDSEYPFLVGMVCKEGDTVKVTDQLRKMPDYSYNGSHSTPTHSVFNIVPYRVYPSGAGERIGHRTGLRCQIFLDKLLRH